MKIEHERSERPKRRGDESPESGHDGYCGFEYSHRRCPFPGNILDGNTWYCLHHMEYPNRAHDQEQHEFFRMFDPNTEQGRECIGDKLEEQYDDKLEARLQTIMAEHQEWRRQDHEGRTDYHRRMFKISKGMRGGPVKTKEAGGTA